jgi:hypothetical protein
MGNIYQLLALPTFIIVSVLLFFFLVYLILIFSLFKFRLKQKYILYEVRPLQVTLQSAQSTQQLFNSIHGIVRQRSLSDKLLGNYKSYSLEIVSTKTEGIRYLIRVNEEDAELAKRSILSYLPGTEINKTSDYIPTDLKEKQSKVVNFKLAGHFAYPLKRQKALKEHDPIAYITGSMTKLSDGDLVSFQIVLTPVGKNTVRDIKKITHDIYKNTDLVNSLRNKKSESLFLGLFKQVLFITIRILTLPVGILVFFASAGKEGPLLIIGPKPSNTKTSNIYQDELEKVVKNKLDQQLLSASLRLLIIGDTQAEVKNRARGFTSTLSSFTTGYQSLTTHMNIKNRIVEKLKIFTFNNRLPEFFSNSVLSVSEVADIYHFPYTATTKTENLVKLHSKQLPAPVSLKKADNLDTVFAKNQYGGSETMIGLTKEERRRHVYILGATGTGKSTMLLSMIKQDLQNNNGLCLIDPHGDLVEQVLSIIPENRIKDVVYFNPDDISYPVGINLLELTPGLSADEAIREKEFIAESIISIFHKIYTDRYSGPRMEYILRNTIHTAFTVPDATLFTVYKLLINTTYRKSVVSGLTDDNLKDFWNYEFAKAGDFQKVKMISPITNKIGRFLFSPTAKRILEQKISTINFDEIIDGKMFLCNVSKGKIGEDNSEVFGLVALAKIQLAALKRARKKMKDRRDFYLYVDEFQNFATPSFAQILSEARKYRLNAVLAHQTTSQIENKSLVNITLANTGTVICFRTANPEDESLILPQFKPYVEKGEITSLPAFRFYMRIGALNPEETFSGVTTPVDIKENSLLINKIIESSRKRYAVEYKMGVKAGTKMPEWAESSKSAQVTELPL